MLDICETWHTCSDKTARLNVWNVYSTSTVISRGGCLFEKQARHSWTPSWKLHFRWGLWDMSGQVWDIEWDIILNVNMNTFQTPLTDGPTSPCVILLMWSSRGDFDDEQYFSLSTGRGVLITWLHILHISCHQQTTDLAGFRLLFVVTQVVDFACEVLLAISGK